MKLSIHKTYPDFEFACAARYDTTYIIKQALDKVGNNPEKIKDYLYSMESFTGALGTYRFDEKGDMVGIMPAVNQIKDRKIVKYDG